MKQILTLLLLLTTLAATAARVDTLRVDSPAMSRPIDVTVVIPDRAGPTSHVPTIYLLNGHGGDHLSFFKIRPDLTDLADQYGYILVLPNGNNSWYWDSPVDPGMKFETFVATELPAYIDTHYPTIPSPAKRAVTGYSMGGHGALYLSLRHPDIFGAAGSMSGGVDIRPFPDSWDMKTRLGDKATHPDNWENYTVINLVDSAETFPAMIIDCGYDDFFLDVNNALHAKLLERRIPHDYIIRPGAHTRDYWCNALPYHLMFFTDYFSSEE